MIFIYLLVALLLIVVDQLVKFLVVQHISFHETIPVLKGILSLTNIRNTGAAWSILEGNRAFFFVVTAIAVGACLYYLPKFAKKDIFYSTSIALILSGTIGNFLDRLRLGYVVDMFQIDFFDFPIFNVADICLVVGVALLILRMLLLEKE